ncbi:type II toxin-antitoxin system antitoxin SocA domain-containing protein [uncultured Methanobrevibacter sp.]|uniref:type II toxin-antitoxin system antitoxin SocA domain-containing protein n=1 Tax=uncultured Methanobrevibacter sp. TaxID=253161 RepID=UPI002606376F
MRFKKEKYITILMFIISRCSDNYNVGKTVLSNILYFIDFNYFEIYGESLTNEIYIKSYLGAVPSHFDEVVRELVYYGKIYKRREPYFYHYINKYYLTSIQNIDLEYKEQIIINDVIDNLRDFSAVEIVDYVMEDFPFKMAGFDESIDYSYVFYRSI